MKVPELRFFAILAFVMTLFFSVIWIASATTDGEWIFGADSLSRMGISENPLSAFLFNFGCIVSGLSGIVIGFGPFAYGKRMMRVSGAFFMIAMVFLAFVGIFKMPTTEHFVVAASYGVFLSISIFITLLADWRLSWYPYFDIVFMVAGFAIVLTQPFELWEAIMVIAALIWTMVMGYKMLVRDDKLFSKEPWIGKE